MILDNHRITIREIADDVGTSLDSYQATFTNVLGMKYAAAKIVSKFLNFAQKQHCMDIAQQTLTDHVQHLLKEIITGIESLEYGFDNEIKAKTEKTMLILVKCDFFTHCYTRLECRGAWWRWILAKRSHGQ